jgi:hypothetical protein
MVSGASANGQCKASLYAWTQNCRPERQLSCGVAPVKPDTGLVAIGIE